MKGTASRKLSDLCPCVARALKNMRSVQGACPEFIVVETLRDGERQAEYVRLGASRTMLSKHLPQPPHGKSLAVDLVPVEYAKLKMWNPNGRLWDVLAEYARRQGLLWGGDWLGWKDRPHFYYASCMCEVLGK